MVDKAALQTCQDAAGLLQRVLEDMTRPSLMSPWFSAACPCETLTRQPIERLLGPEARSPSVQEILYYVLSAGRRHRRQKRLKLPYDALRALLASGSQKLLDRRRFGPCTRAQYERHVAFANNCVGRCLGRIMARLQLIHDMI
jgi:hypothetical protein